MTGTSRRAILAIGVVVALVVGACASTNPGLTTSPGSGTISAAPSVVAATAAPTAASSAAARPTASAEDAQPPVPSPLGPSAPACPISHQTGLPPSDRLLDLAIASTPTSDLVTFVFAAPSSPTPAGSPRGSLDAAMPPFSFAGSGAAINLLGQHAVQLRFTGMTIASDTGASTYQGPTDAKPNLPALREAIQFDASEGVIGWYLGFDGPGCVTLSRSGNDVTVQIGHPEAPAG